MKLAPITHSENVKTITQLPICNSKLIKIKAVLNHKQKWPIVCFNSNIKERISSILSHQDIFSITHFTERNPFAILISAISNCQVYPEA